MKNVIKSALVFTVVIGASGFTNPAKEKMIVKESTIEWKGKKILGSHTGTIDLKEGYIEMDGDQLVGGMFVVDMTSLKNSDLSGDNKAKLEGHLKSDDFFGVANHPTATLVINGATNKGNVYTVNGDMTIKGITKPISFELIMGKTASRTSLKIDRTEYNVRYGSGSLFDSLGDNTISDKFELDVTLKF
jgi:polyisoprenoid-binding protein YceI